LHCSSVLIHQLIVNYLTCTFLSTHGIFLKTFTGLMTYSINKLTENPAGLGL